MLELNDTVDIDQAAFLRNIHVVNMREEAREVRLFMHQAFTINDSASAIDTARYLHEYGAIKHYQGDTAFIIGGQSETGRGFDQHSIGAFGTPTQEGTFRDADDGELSMGNVEYGRVDSTIRFSLTIPAQDSRYVQYWIAAGETHKSALTIHKNIRQNGVHVRIQRTLKEWHEWVKPIAPVIEKIDATFKDSFIKSLLLIKSHINSNGSIVSANTEQASPQATLSSTYAASAVVWPLIRLGYVHEPRQFFDFYRRVLKEFGTVPSLVRSDGSAAPDLSTTSHGKISAASDNTAGSAFLLFMFGQFQQAHQDSDLLNDFYDSFVKPLATSLTLLVDNKTMLPKDSDDQPALTYTVAVACAALQSASDMAEKSGDADNAVAWKLASVDMSTAAQRLLVDQATDLIKPAAKNIGDTLLDSSAIFSSFMFGLLPSDSTSVDTSIQRMASTLNDSLLGIPASLNINQPTYDSCSTISSLWLAQYFIEHNKIEDALAIIQRIIDSSSATYQLPETIYEDADKTRSNFSSSCWAHAEFVSTILDMIAQPKEG